ncbi:hypothetical protein AAFF_G00044170 [Aldrovandia affinis]|uniref:Uncharacterized protein n=1 Tax=Aldrovandia affinis TaxID=143900 RepID=A0AAD7S270_9TELE|nr:hypothetical protein AAFF_G00044170 [Aldrovandia affinis]
MRGSGSHRAQSHLQGSALHLLPLPPAIPPARPPSLAWPPSRHPATVRAANPHARRARLNTRSATPYPHHPPHLLHIPMETQISPSAVLAIFWGVTSPRMFMTTPGQRLHSQGPKSQSRAGLNVSAEAHISPLTSEGFTV